MNAEQALQRLAHAGLVARERDGWRTTAKWQRALMKTVIEYREAADDLRLPVTYALVEVLGPKVPEDELKALVEAILPLEMQEEQDMEPELEGPRGP